MATATLGILMLDTVFPRIPGDVGNAQSYDFPIRMKTIRGATVQRAVFDADPTLLDDFVAGARELEAEGVAAITSSCGFLALLQAQVAGAVHIPVFLSSLMQLPLVHSMAGGRIAILTANAASLTAPVLHSAGISADIPLAIAGLQDVAAFRDAILYDGQDLQTAVIEAEIVKMAQGLLVGYPDVSAFVLECHNLSPYSRAIQLSTGKPVFDIVSFATWVYSAVASKPFPRG